MITVDSITFAEQGLVITYLDEANDVRVGGQVVLTHQIQLSRKHPDYRDDMDALHDLATRVVRNALSDYEESEPVPPPSDRAQDDEGEDEMGSAHHY